MDATLIVPTYNRAGLIRRLFQHVRKLDLSQLAQLIVCDDGSSDDTAAVCAAARDVLPIEYCYQPDQGFRAGAARNLGIQRAIGDVLIFIDDDCFLLEGFIAAHCAAHVQPRQVVALGLRARTVAPLDDRTLQHWQQFSTPDEREAELGDGLHAHPTPWKLLFSCNFSIRRDNAEAYFDESFVGWGMEDTELGYRLWLAGTEFRLVDEARVLHVEAARPRDPFRLESRGVQPDYHSYLVNCVRLLSKFRSETPLWDSLLPDLCWYAHDGQRGWIKDGQRHDPYDLIQAMKEELCSTQSVALPIGH